MRFPPFSSSTSMTFPTNTLLRPVSSVLSVVIAHIIRDSQTDAAVDVPDVIAILVDAMAVKARAPADAHEVGRHPAFGVALGDEDMRVVAADHVDGGIVDVDAPVWMAVDADDAGLGRWHGRKGTGHSECAGCKQLLEQMFLLHNASTFRNADSMTNHDRMGSSFCGEIREIMCGFLPRLGKWNNPAVRRIISKGTTRMRRPFIVCLLLA